MTLISVLLGIAADRLLTHLHDYRHYHYFLHYVDWMRGRIHGPAWDHIGGLLIVLLPVWLTEKKVNLATVSPGCIRFLSGFPPVC